jgi:ankyrin repeat protein
MKGANIEAKNKYGMTPLHQAAFVGQTETVEFLIRAGANREALNAVS